MLGPDQDPIRQAITIEFFRVVAERSNEYDLFVSRVVIDELDDGTEEQRIVSDLILASFSYAELPQNDDAEDLAWIYVREGVRSQTHIDDLRHVGSAVVSGCDYIITWNMRHLANEWTVRRVNAVNALENYGKIYIATPEFFTGGQIYGQ